MSESAKVESEDDKLTVTKIYKNIITQFKQNLYWDMLSTLKEKPVFKDIKQAVEKLVKDKSDVICETESYNGTEKDKLVSELCAMAFTVDTIYSKVLFAQLEQEFKVQIVNIIKDLRKEGEIPDNVWTQLQIPDSDDSETDKQAQAQKMDTPSTSVSANKKGKVTCNGDNKFEKLKHVTKSNGEKEKQEGKRIETRRKATPKKESSTLPTAIPSTSKQDMGEIINMSSNRNDEDNDSDSDISVGHVSIASVSSVHTSELSSFDDEISLSSEEEGGTKRRLSFKELMASRIGEKLKNFKPKKYTKTAKKSYKNSVPESSEVKTKKSYNNSVPESSEVKTKKPYNNSVPESPKVKKNSNDNNILESPEVKKNQKSTPDNSKEKVSVEATENCSESSITSHTFTPDSSSKRVRKPNSKYSSEDVIFHSMKVKTKKKLSAASTKKEDEKSSSEHTPVKKRTKTATSDDEETPIKIQKTEAAKDANSSDDKSLPKQPETSDFYKPHTSVVRSLTTRSLTSRRTAPLTLYSTAP